jgi:Cu-processing system permease protein
VKQHILVAWRSGLRSRSIHALLFLGLLVMGGALLAAMFSGRQPHTVALDVGLSGIRFISLLMVLVWCQDLVGREIDRRTVYLALAYPAPRASYLLGRYLGVALLASIGVVILGVLLMVTVKFSGGTYVQASDVHLGGAFWATMGFILMDVLVVAAFAFLIAAIATTPLMPLALGAAFAIAARSLGPALDYLHDSQSGAAGLAHTLAPVVESIRWIVPDLSRLDIRLATLYGQWPAPETLMMSLGMALAYICVMMSVAIYVFGRREFS